MLGGVEIAKEGGLVGHSDADVVLHAICDALLGASGLSDIGELFPDDDEQYRGADSRELLRQVMRLVTDTGFRPLNVDVIIHAERPRMKPHRERIRTSVAELLSLEPNAVGVKATTNEQLGDIGRGEAIAAWAAVTLGRRMAGESAGGR
jgi:2-C-methyl-D-erythritol 2,4-cyclodiphosphate synthase